MQITMTGKYQTRSGLEYVCFGTDFTNPQSVAGKIKDSNGWFFVTHDIDGSFYDDMGKSAFDLIPIPETKTPQEQVAELLAIAEADTSLEWFTGAPPAVGWYLCSYGKWFGSIRYWNGHWWSNDARTHTQMECLPSIISTKYQRQERLRWATPWWPEEWSQAYWEEQA